MKPAIIAAGILGAFILGCLCQRFVFGPPVILLPKSAKELQADLEQDQAELDRQHSELSDLQREHARLEQEIKSLTPPPQH